MKQSGNALKLKQLFIYLLLFLTVKVNSAETLDVIVGLSKPPYVLENIQQGYELELVRAVLAKMGKWPNYIFVPFGRSEKILKGQGIDALLTANSHIIKSERLLSDTYIVYQNVAISLSERNLEIETIDDLAKYTVTSFQNAHIVLGKQFAEAVNKSPFYSQVARQQVQLDMLLKGRSDVIVLDINIFNYFFKNYEVAYDRNKIKVHNIFPPSPYQVAFNDTSLISKFNLALKEFKTTEDYLALREKYGLSH